QLVTFPDGAALRALFMEQPGRLAQLGIPASLACAALSLGLANLGEVGRAELAQLVAVSLFAGTVALWAYLTGAQRIQPADGLLNMHDGSNGYPEPGLVPSPT